MMSKIQIEKIQAWWQGRAPREQWVIGIGLVFLLLTILYSWIYSPLVDTAYQRKTLYLQQKALNAWMEHAEATLQDLQTAMPNPIVPSTVSTLADDLQNSLEAQHLDTYQHQLQNQGATVQIHFIGVPFDGVARWLELLWKQYHVDVKALLVSKKKEAGRVDLSVTVGV